MDDDGQWIKNEYTDTETGWMNGWMDNCQISHSWVNVGWIMIDLMDELIDG